MKKLCSSWVTILTHTTSQGPLRLLNLHALKNTGEQTSQLRKPTTKECKWLGQGVRLPALNQFSLGQGSRPWGRQARLSPLQSKQPGSRPVIFQPPINPSAVESGISCWMQRTHQGKANSLQRRHPRVLPPCPLCGWGLTAAPHVGGSASTRSSSDVLRLLSPHKGWKLPLFSPWSPVPNQYGSPGWTTEGLEATWRGNVEDRMPAWTPGYSYQTHQERPPPWALADPQNHEK